MRFGLLLRRTDKNISVNMSKAQKTGPAKSLKKIITSPDVYPPVGPYSQAVMVDKTIYVSGVLGMDAGCNMQPGTENQTRQALDNLRFILEAGESSLKGVVKTTILLANIEDAQLVNSIYGEYFHGECPARMTYEVSKLPLNACIEIDAIAIHGIKDESTCPCTLKSQR